MGYPPPTDSHAVTVPRPTPLPTGLEEPPICSEGENRIAVSLKDRAANTGTAASVFTIVITPPPPPPFRAKLVKVSGNGQVGLPGRPFPEPIIWKLVDDNTNEHFAVMGQAAIQGRNARALAHELAHLLGVQQDLVAQRIG